MKRVLLALSAILALHGAGASAGEADVVDIRVRAEGEGRWRFDVSVEHADAGWDHYADRWEVLDLDGRILGTRVLLHPHDNEQPFTRSLGGVEIPAGVTKVRLRAHDSVHGFGGVEAEIELPR